MFCRMASPNHSSSSVGSGRIFLLAGIDERFLALSQPAPKKHEGLISWEVGHRLYMSPYASTLPSPASGQNGSYQMIRRGALRDLLSVHECRRARSCSAAIRTASMQITSRSRECAAHSDISPSLRASPGARRAQPALIGRLAERLAAKQQRRRGLFDQRSQPKESQRCRGLKSQGMASQSQESSDAFLRLSNDPQARRPLYRCRPACDWAWAKGDEAI
jgi:hypothetical protein